jgi:small subunit ribosomal protein S28e
MEDATPAEIIAIMGREGTKGITRVRCRLVDGKEKGKILTRNVLGPVKMGDVIILRETEMESSGTFRRR